MNRRKLTALLCAVTMTASLLSGCADAQKNTVQTTDKTTEIEEESTITNQTAAASAALSLSEAALTDTWDDASATKISLNDTSVEISGDGAKADGSIVTISSAGTYVLSGTLSDGQILIDAGDDDIVQLVMNGTDLSCLDSAPIYGVNADEIVLTLAEGTENIISDGTTYSYEADEEEPDAAVFSHDDLDINGSGSLTVNGNYLKGIRSKDDLTIVDGTLNVTAVDDAISGKDGLYIAGGTFVVNAGEDALKSSNDSDTDKGDVHITAGIFSINAGDDAVHAEKNLIIDGGTINIESSTEALEGMTVTINGGDINLVSSDDGINAAGTGLADDTAAAGMTANDTGTKDSAAASTKEQVSADESNEKGNRMPSDEENMTPPSGEMMTPSDGETMTPTDGKTKEDFSDVKGGFGGGKGGFMDEATDYNYIRITGGTITVDTGGDGIDSNGNLYVSGGNITIYGPTNDGNSSLDYAGTFEITGGTFLAAGSSGMAQNASDSSSQPALLVYLTSAQEAGTIFTLCDESGNTITSITPIKSFQCVLFSTPDMAQGKTYTVKSNDTELCTVTLEKIITSISEDGSEVQGGMGGRNPGNMGGERPENADNARPEAGAVPDGTAGEKPSGTDMEPPADGTAPEGAPAGGPGDPGGQDGSGGPGGQGGPGGSTTQ